MASIFLRPRAGLSSSAPKFAWQQKRWKVSNSPMAAAAQMNAQMPKARAQPSLRILPEGSENIPRDIGLLPNTFIQPTGGNVPSWFKDRKGRMELLKMKWKYKVSNVRDLLAWRWYARAPFDLFSPKKIALSLYKDMYTSFALSDIKSLRQICNDGLYESFKGRITSRRNKMHWQLHSLIGTPKIVSNSATVFVGTDTAIRQAVVRIHSKQSISKYTAQGDLVPGTGQQKDVLEYVVLQKRKLKNDETEWTIWGTTEETTLKVLEEREKKRFF
ncbi:hypothetical protein DFH27DRAFT_557652 [Peziza echinospora]|nr:hypothetical protein DFH27DRAFT_557652 [Peziza echinospora]